MKQLTINWPDLEFAFEDYGDEFGSTMDCSNYLDLATGDVILIDEQVTDAMNSIIDELDSALDVGAGWTDDAIRATERFRQLAEAEKKSVLAAIEIDYGDSGHFERIPRFDSRDCFGFMEEFIATVNDDDKSSRLREAVSQRKPFRRFRDVLADDQRLERQWLEFENVRQRKSIVEWLHSIGIKPTNPDVTRFNPAPLPDLRKIMFSEVRRFVRLARDIEVVRRIALIGPLTTDKEFPRAIDLVVTVSDHCELAPLAKLGRELTGHMNNHRAGADVFLASEHGDYLGRTCPWRDCGPGCRVRCDARHCGARHYLYDDLDTFQLEEDLIAQPRVVLWPDLVAAENVPLDVQEQLIEQLAQDQDR